MGLTPIILKIKENLIESDALLLEGSIIKVIGLCSSHRGPLTNIVMGGKPGTKFVNYDLVHSLYKKKLSLIYCSAIFVKIREFLKDTQSF